jgi:acetyl esterase
MTMPRPSHVHPDMQVLYDARSPVPATTVGERRHQWNEYARKLSRPAPEDLAVEDLTIPTSVRAIPARVYRRRDGGQVQPCVVYMHGGGFMLGDLDSSDSIAWGYAFETGATVVSVDYRLSPENPWPAAFDDCYSVIQWLSENSVQMRIDARRIALAGDSAGGRLTAGLCIKARDEKGPLISAQVMVYASAGAIRDSRSAVEFAEGYGLTTARYREFYDALFPDNSYDDSPYAWPMRADDVSGLPPALVHPAEFDPIRDDGRAYAAKLARAGTTVTLREAKGMIHGFMRARFTGAAARSEYNVICAFLREHLGLR